MSSENDYDYYHHNFCHNVNNFFNYDLNIFDYKYKYDFDFVNNFNNNVNYYHSSAAEAPR